MSLSVISETEQYSPNNTIFSTWMVTGFGKIFRIMFYRSPFGDILGLSRVDVSEEGSWLLVTTGSELGGKAVDDTPQGFFNRSVSYLNSVYNTIEE